MRLSPRLGQADGFPRTPRAAWDRSLPNVPHPLVRRRLRCFCSAGGRGARLVVALGSRIGATSSRFEVEVWRSVTSGMGASKSDCETLTPRAVPYGSRFVQARWRGGERLGQTSSLADEGASRRSNETFIGSTPPGFQVWQRGHQWVLRPAIRWRIRVVPQRRQGRPLRL